MAALSQALSEAGAFEQPERLGQRDPLRQSQLAPPLGRSAEGPEERGEDATAGRGEDGRGAATQ